MTGGLSREILEAIFDVLDDVVFFVKDAEGRYTHANLTLVRRLGLKARSDVIGRSVLELFPEEFGRSYAAQDRRVLGGDSIRDLLEVHFLSLRRPGWCLTSKLPLSSGAAVDGLVGISRDLRKANPGHPDYARLVDSVAYLEANYDRRLRVQELADIAGVSVHQLERLFRRVFRLNPQQMLVKLRVEAAMRALDAGDSVADVALACGFADQSAFSRQFKKTVGATPREFRLRARR